MLFIKSNLYDESIRKILINPILWKLTYGQSSTSIDSLNNDIFYLIKDSKNKNIEYGLLYMKEISKITAEIHILILPEYWGTGISVKIGKEALSFSNLLGYENLMAFVPEICTEVLRYVMRLDFKKIGKISDGIIFNNIKQDLYIFQKQLLKNI